MCRFFIINGPGICKFSVGISSSSIRFHRALNSVDTNLLEHYTGHGEKKGETENAPKSEKK